MQYYSCPRSRKKHSTRGLTPAWAAHTREEKLNTYWLSSQDHSTYFTNFIIQVCDLCSFEGTHPFALEAHLSLIHNEIISKSSSSVHFKCDICKHESISETALHRHKSLKPDINIPHTSQWDKKKCHICNTVFTETTLFKNHMIKLHGFSDEHSDECMNCESTEVGDYRPVPSQHIFMNCKNCELFEAES